MRKILVIQNEAEEGLGLFEDELKLANIEYDVVHPYKGDTIPTGLMLDEAGYRGLMILGGPMSADDDANHPFLAEEVQLIRDALKRYLPMLNICLGAQLLARALHMPLTKGGEKEVGWKTIYLNNWYTKRNPLFFQLPLEFTSFHWHQDTFDIPTEGYNMARSDFYPHQILCYQGNAYGLQFHPEMTETMIRAWIEKDKQRPDRMLSEVAADQVISQMKDQLPQQKKYAHQIFYGFETLIRPADYRRPLKEEEPEVEAKPEGEPSAETAPAAEAGAAEANP